MKNVLIVLIVFLVIYFDTVCCVVRNLAVSIL